jgi:hypothetical protein
VTTCRFSSEEWTTSKKIAQRAARTGALGRIVSQYRESRLSPADHKLAPFGC